MLFQVSNSSRVLDNASEATGVAWKSINDLLETLIARLPFIAAGLIVALSFYLAAKVIKYLFLAGSKRTRLDERLRLLFSRLIVVGVIVLGIFTALTVIVPSFRFGDLVAGVGLTTFIIGFATKDILNNLLSGVLILWQRPFRIGDQIFVGTTLGRVEYIGVRATSLRKDDGELVLVPNGEMYSGTLVIRGAGIKRKMSVNVKVAYDTDIELAKSSIRSELLATDGVVSDPPPYVLITDLAPEGVNIRVNFWINTTEVLPREVFDRAAAATIDAMNNMGVEPYPPGSLVVKNAPETDIVGTNGEMKEVVS
jgi:small-conductance mechanosensitive channel